MANDPHWIEHAHFKTGAFTKKANAAHKSVAALAQADQHKSGTTGRQARAAQTLRHLSQLK